MEACELILLPSIDESSELIKIDLSSLKHLDDSIHIINLNTNLAAWLQNLSPRLQNPANVGKGKALQSITAGHSVN
jgi:hypothetical protein